MDWAEATAWREIEAEPLNRKRAIAAVAIPNRTFFIVDILTCPLRFETAAENASSQDSGAALGL
jgi:hypothetical protein